jgi:hypothetical protein
MGFTTATDVEPKHTAASRTAAGIRSELATAVTMLHDLRFSLRLRAVTGAGMS